jgi:hypothetical protein
MTDPANNPARNKKAAYAQALRREWRRVQIAFAEGHDPDVEVPDVEVPEVVRQVRAMHEMLKQREKLTEDVNRLVELRDQLHAKVASQPKPPDKGMLASDTDRESVAKALRQAYDEGRLTVDQLDDRLERAYAERHVNPLRLLVADIPLDGGARPLRSRGLGAVALRLAVCSVVGVVLGVICAVVVYCAVMTVAGAG